LWRRCNVGLMSRIGSPPVGGSSPSVTTMLP